MPWKSEMFIVDGDPVGSIQNVVEYLHVVWPSEDLVEHQYLSMNCACGPDHKVIIGVHGHPQCVCVMTQVTHNSLDGRELSE